MDEVEEPRSIVEEIKAAVAAGKSIRLRLHDIDGELIEVVDLPTAGEVQT